MKKLFAAGFLLVTAIVSRAQPAASSFHPVVPDNIADPSIAVFDGTFYLYGTTDINHGLGEMGPPVVWKSKDFVNWSFDGTILPEINWSKPYEYTDARGMKKTGYFRYWAPGKPLKKDNKYYLFPTIVKPDEKMGTFALVADRPEGPFKFAGGEGVFFNEPDKAAKEARPLAPDIDGEVFVDHDGAGYVVWRRRNMAKLSKDLLSIEGPSVQVPTKMQGYSEGPTLFERKGIYYYIYTLSGSANYSNAYMISRKGPMGPWEEPQGPNVFISSDIETGIWGPGHGNVLQIPGKDEFYFTYLEFSEGGTSRQTFINKLEFNADGTIKPVKVNGNGVGYLGKNQRTSPNFALKAVASASSNKNDRLVKAQIETQPNLLTNFASSRFTGPNVKDASRTYTYAAQNAIDGSNMTRWVAAADDKAPWYELDLGKTTTVKNCEFFFVLPSFGQAWTLEKSLDGKTWEPAAKQETLKICSPHVAPGIGKARYLRLNITQGSPGIWEMNVY